MRLHEGSNSLREQHLPAVPGTHNARGLMDIGPDVAVSALVRFAGMQPDAHAYGPSLRPGVKGERALHGDGSRDRIGRTSENQEEGIPLRIYLVTIGGGAGCTQQLAIVC